MVFNNREKAILFDYYQVVFHSKNVEDLKKYREELRTTLDEYETLGGITHFEEMLKEADKMTDSKARMLLDERFGR